MHALTAAAADGALGALATLRVAANDIGAEPLHALATALTDGALGALAELVVPTGQERHAVLSSVCRTRGVKLV